VIVFPPGLTGGDTWQEMAERRKALRDHYHEYLRSPTWRAIRNGALKNAFFRCERCGRADALEVHHVTYARLGGDELLEDLEVLCETCHYGHHTYAAAYLDYLK
jgi:5-methylcytosine-specific restriction endonuclease McrA